MRFRGSTLKLISSQRTGAAGQPELTLIEISAPGRTAPSRHQFHTPAVPFRAIHPPLSVYPCRENVRPGPSWRHFSTKKPASRPHRAADCAQRTRPPQETGHSRAEIPVWADGSVPFMRFRGSTPHCSHRPLRRNLRSQPFQIPYPPSRRGNRVGGNRVTRVDIPIEFV
jgi:hypothetical protein